MKIEEFSSGSSPIHRLDPRVKIIVALLFAVVTAIADRMVILGLALAAGAILVLLAGLNFHQVGRRLFVVNTFVLLLWIVLPFSYPGEAVFSIGPLAATREGLLYALAITIKSNAIILTIIALLATSPVFSLVHALTHLKAPMKLVQLLFFTFRYFHVMHQEYQRLRKAMRIRCFTARTDLHTYRSLAYLVGMLLVRSFDRSERVYQAMICRGFHGEFWVLDHFSLRGRDMIFLAIMIAFILFLSTVQWTNLLI